MIDKDDMNKLLKQIRGIATNVNQVVYRVNSTGNITAFVKLSVSRNQLSYNYKGSIRRYCALSAMNM